jgi:Cu-processing system ATP-binding protein
MDKIAIEISNLSKHYGKFTVFRNINAKINSGSITAILGPNGSGKSTLVKCILGMVRPSGGHISIDGSLVDQDNIYRKNIGYMPQSAKFPENLSAKDLKGMLVGLRNAEREELDDELIGSFRLERDGYLEKPTGILSGGTRQKINAFLAFLFDPHILILDEPTVELDPISSGRLKEKIFKGKQKGKTILMPSHIISEVEEIADYIIFLSDQKIYVQGTVNEIKSMSGEQRLEKAIANIMQRDYSE